MIFYYSALYPSLKTAHHIDYVPNSLYITILDVLAECSILTSIIEITITNISLDLKKLEFYKTFYIYIMCINNLLKL